MKRSWVIVLALVVIVALAGLYYAKAGHVPAGQPPLVEIDSHTLSELQADFNRTAGSVRVILLISPT